MIRHHRSLFAGLAVLTLVSMPIRTAAQQVRSSASRTNTPAALGIHGFSVIVVVGAMQGTAASDGVPDVAKKALNDMRDFLPFKRYQLLDAAWMLCCAAYKAGVSGKVRGPNERDYSYHVDPIGVTDGKLNLRFSMREMYSGPVMSKSDSVKYEKLTDSARLEHSRQLYEAIRERDEAELLARSLKKKHEVGIANTPDLEAAQMRHARASNRVEDLQRIAGGARAGGGTSGQNIMDSTFSIALGETVVVGTSRLNGDQALIALLTAAAKPGAAR
jgi:hypothetical protein